MSAIVCQIVGIEKHPNADKLELVYLSTGAACSQPECDGAKPHLADTIRVVTGPHYKEGWLGVYCPPGTVLPGYLARDAWLVGEGKYNQWYTVSSKNMRGIESPGVFFCQWYVKDKTDDRSVERAEMMANPAFRDWSQEEKEKLTLATPIYPWPMWNKRFKVGQDVSAYLGIRSCIDADCSHPNCRGQG